MVLAALAATGCAGEEAALPRGTPAAVLARTPDATLAAGRAMVIASARTARAEADVDFRRFTAAVTYEPADLRDPRLELRDPIAVVDLVRGATEIDPYGGSEVRGASTMRYQVKIDAGLAATRTPADRRAGLEAVATDLDGRTVFADVYVDRHYRLRRVTLPADYREERPRGRDRRIVEVITVDFTNYPDD